MNRFIRHRGVIAALSLGLLGNLASLGVSGSVGAALEPWSKTTPSLNPLNPLQSGGSIPVAQASPTPEASNSAVTLTNCYWSTLQLGVYREPNVLSEAIGVLPAGAIVLIGPGSGQGWVRLQAPIIGWMVPQGFQPNPLKGCTGLGSLLPPRSETVPTAPNPTAPAPTVPTPTPIASPAPVSADPGVPPSNRMVLCEVLNPAGLEVRNQPILHPRTLIAILATGQHRFQFSDRRVTLQHEGTASNNGNLSTGGRETRDWIYITAPTTGWITLRVQGQTSTLAGQNCS